METSVTSVSAMEAQQARMPGQKEHRSFITGWLEKEKRLFPPSCPTTGKVKGKPFVVSDSRAITRKKVIFRHKRNAFFLFKNGT